MKKPFLLVIVAAVVLIGALWITGNFPGGGQLQRLKQKVENDSLLMMSLTEEVNTINQTLDSVSQLDKDLRSVNNIGKKEALEKIRIINQLLSDRQETIETLNQRIEELEFEYNQSVAEGMYKESNEQLSVTAEYYDDLYSRIDELEAEVVVLREVIEQKDKELIEKDNIIEQIKEEREQQEARLKELQNEITRTEQEFEQARLRSAQNYYDLALDLRGVADKTSGFLNRHKKTMLVNMAYEYFQKADTLGYEPAKQEIEMMETDREFSKFLEENTEK